MVIGGGVAGIQASLELSTAGFGVYLVERSASLGGMIPNLHRIFPLCACCKLDSRIASCMHDPNIRVMTETTVKGVSGKSGNFNIVLEMGEKEESVHAGAIIFSAGLEPFDPTVFDTYAYGHFPNVVTSVELEQMQKPLGPKQGQIRRPSDGAIPQKVAWLQCVGSRDINHCDAPYCSSVCCMYALKEAVNIKEGNDSTDATIFYMDMRTHGKGFERYFNRAVDLGVELVRSRVHSVTQVADSDDLLIMYADESGEVKRDVFDLVVLSVGVRPSGEAVSLAKTLGIELNEDHYFSSRPFSPTSTNIPGILACGAFHGPLDISQSLIQASSCTTEVSAFLDPEPFVPKRSYPEPLNVPLDPPSVFVAYHLCPEMDEDIARTIQEHAKTLPDVTAATRVKGDLLGDLVQGLKNSKANRLVFASCSPFTNKSLVEESLRLTGLNPFLYEMVDLRAMDPKTPTPQLKDRLRMGVARATLMDPPATRKVPVEKRALVVGGGIAGLESALAIAQAGFPVTLVEKEREIGGNASHVRCTWRGEDVQKHINELMSQVKGHANIELFTQTTVKESTGFAGSFLSILEQGKQRHEVAHGVAILTTGGKTYIPSEYGYGENKKVYTWEELSRKLMAEPDSVLKAKSAVFIQCVGSREPGRPYCSNLCCTFSVRTAVDLKSKNPDMDIFILYREMRTFGERESLYREAREKGVIFVRYDLDHKPVVGSIGEDGTTRVTAYDPILGKHIVVDADFISLQTAVIPNDTKQLAEVFRIETDPDDFFAESPEKLRPMETSTPGIYVAGLAHYPKDTGESIAQARAAAARTMEILKRDSVETGGQIAEVKPEKCAVCCTCVRTCPFQIPFIDHERGAAYIDPGLCRGCGMCVAECPGKAIIMSSCSDKMLNQAPLILMMS